MLTLIQGSMIVIYGLSLGLYLVDMVTIRYSLERIAYRLLLIGGIIQGVYFVNVNLLGSRIPLLTLYDLLFFYSLILMLLTIIIRIYSSWKLFSFATLLLGVILLAFAWIIGDSTPSIDQELLSKLVYIHIFLSILSYVAFSLSAIFALLYLLQDYLLKMKVWNRFTRLLPNMESLNRNARYTNMVGVFLLCSGLLLGSIWASLLFSWQFFIDPKVLTSLVILFVYCYWLFHAKRKSLSNKYLAVWNLFGFILVMINFVVSSVFYSFHRFL